MSALPIEKAAVDAAAPRVRGLSRRTFRASVRAASETQIWFARATFTGQRRKAVLKTLPSARDGADAGLPSPDGIDVWTWEAGREPARLTTCRACDGTTRGPCRECGGKKTTEDGLECTCSDGKDSCDACGGTGKVEAFIAILEDTFQREMSDGDPEMCDLAGISTWEGPLEELPPEHAELVAHLTPSVPPSERLTRVKLDWWSLDGARARFRLAAVDGEIVVREDAVVRAVLPAVGAYRGAVVSAGLLALFCAAMAASAYIARDVWWYALTPNAGVLVAMVLLLPPLAVMAARELCMPRFRIRVIPKVFLLLVALGGTGAMLAFGGPSLSLASAQLAAGKLDPARTTAQALVRQGIDAARANDLLDAIATRRFAETTDLAAAADVVSTQFVSDAARATALATLEDRIDAQAAADGAAGDWTTAPKLVALLPEDRRRDPRHLLVLHTAANRRFDGCLVTLDGPCAAEAEAAVADAGGTPEEVAAMKARADQASTVLLTPLWGAVTTKRNPTAARGEACAAALLPTDFAAAAGTGKVAPTRAELDEACSQLPVDK